jgi:hypothetical protein
LFDKTFEPGAIKLPDRVGVDISWERLSVDLSEIEFAPIAGNPVRDARS